MLADGQPARAAATFRRALEGARGAELRQSYLGLAAALEALRECEGVVSALSSFLRAFPEDAAAPDALMRRGACQAELGDWEASAESYAKARRRAGPEMLPSVQVETFAREGFARFTAGDLDGALRVLEAGEEAYQAGKDRERFASYYFVGMMRFYRAAVWHRRFRDLPIRSARRLMEADFARKVELLTRAQEGYRDTIRAKHMFWVSAAGFQMGQLFAEFYDAMMYAPVPSWLGPKEREIYYEELRRQLRPALEKAIWVFEKNLEAARRLGYESTFVARTQEKLAHLRAVVLAGQGHMGEPSPRLAPEVTAPVGPAGVEEGGVRSVAERKLFVPVPTPL